MIYREGIQTLKQAQNKEAFLYKKDLCIAPVSNLKIELFQFNEQFHKQFVKSLDMHKNVIERMDKQRSLDITMCSKKGERKS